MEGSSSPSPLTDEHRSELKKMRGQLAETSDFLNGLLQAWNHAGEQEYRDLKETAEAAEAARQAAERID